MVAESDRGICAISLGDDAQLLLEQLQNRFKAAELIRADSLLKQRVVQVLAMVEDSARDLDLPLDIQGTAFQQRVWEFLRHIPAGQTLSYTEIAERLGYADVTTFIEAFRRWKGVAPSTFRRAQGLPPPSSGQLRRRFIPR